MTTFLYVLLSNESVLHKHYYPELQRKCTKGACGPSETQNFAYGSLHLSNILIQAAAKL